MVRAVIDSVSLSSRSLARTMDEMNHDQQQRKRTIGNCCCWSLSGFISSVGRWWGTCGPTVTMVAARDRQRKPGRSCPWQPLFTLCRALFGILWSARRLGKWVHGKRFTVRSVSCDRPLAWSLAQDVPRRRLSHVGSSGPCSCIDSCWRWESIGLWPAGRRPAIDG